MDQAGGQKNDSCSGSLERHLQGEILGVQPGGKGAAVTEVWGDEPAMWLGRKVCVLGLSRCSLEVRPQQEVCVKEDAQIESKTQGGTGMLLIVIKGHEA